MAALDPHAPDLEGYLFPETYPLPRRANADALVRAMVSRFEQVFGPDLRDRPRPRGLERARSRDARLAGGEGNRPARGTADRRRGVSQSAEDRHGAAVRPHRHLRAAEGGPLHRQPHARRPGFDSPYNTYSYAGLPPGPIAAPGRPSIEAVLNPADVDYLYFVSRNDGSHVFSNTYEEHRAKVKAFQVDYFRAK